MAERESTTKKGTAFEAEVAEYYRSLGFSVQRNVSMAGTQEVDIVATWPLPDGQSLVVMIECKDPEKRASGNDDVHSISNAYAFAKLHNLAHACVVVTSTKFSEKAQMAAKTAGIHLLTRDDLVRMTQRMPLAYATSIRLGLERDRKPIRHFVRSSARLRSGHAEIPDVAEFLHRRTIADQPGLTLFFGNIGSGKTTHLVSMAERLARDYMSGANTPIGLYIPLERFVRHRQARYFDDFVIDYLRMRFRMADVTWSDVAQWLSSRTAVLLLDGFDEIRHLDSALAVTEEFGHIVNIIGTDCVALMSCRTTLAARSENRLPDMLRRQYVEHGGANPEVVDLNLLTPKEVSGYLAAVGASRNILHGRVAAEVLRRPVLLDVLIDTLSVGPDDGAPIGNASELLEQSITRLLTWRMNLRQAEIPILQWRTFLEECALRMFVDDAKHITPAALSDLIREFFPDAHDAERLRHLDYDAKVRTILDFDLQEKGLRWTHAIFRDYLAAWAIARRLLAPSPADAFLDGRVLAPEQVEFVQHAVQSRERMWRGLRDYRRPTQEPPPISPANRWRWISPGLTMIHHYLSPLGGSRLVYFAKGYWISEQPIAFGDLGETASAILERAVHRGARVEPAIPVTHITNEEASRIAEMLGGRLPAEEEWERAARWIDGSFPRAEVIPDVEPDRTQPPLLARTNGNPWHVRNVSGTIWQWTSAWDDIAQRFVCRGTWWGASMADKLSATKRLLPNEPDHIRTGVRVVADAAIGGEL